MPVPASIQNRSGAGVPKRHHRRIPADAILGISESKPSLGFDQPSEKQQTADLLLYQSQQSLQYGMNSPKQTFAETPFRNVEAKLADNQLGFSTVVWLAVVAFTGFKVTSTIPCVAL